MNVIVVPHGLTTVVPDIIEAAQTQAAFEVGFDEDFFSRGVLRQLLEQLGIQFRVKRITFGVTFYQSL